MWCWENWEERLSRRKWPECWCLQPARNQSVWVKTNSLDLYLGMKRALVTQASDMVMMEAGSCPGSADSNFQSGAKSRQS